MTLARSTVSGVNRGRPATASARAPCVLDSYYRLILIGFRKLRKRGIPLHFARDTLC